MEDQVMFICNVTDERGEVIPRWHEERLKGLGASEIATVVGLNPYQTPLELWAQKTGKVPAKEDNDAMWLGRRLEPVVADFFAKKVQSVDVLERANGLYRHSVHEWALASPDFFCSESDVVGLLQTKTTGAYKQDEWEDGKVPSMYLAQIQWEMAVMSKPYSYLACLIGGRELAHKRFEAEPAVFEQLAEAGAVFMGLVKSDTPPAPTGSDGKLLNQLLKHGETEITLDEKALPLFEAHATYRARRLALEREAAQAEDQEKRVQNELRAMIGKHGRGVCGKHAINCTLVPGGTYTANRADYYKVTVR